MKVQTIVLGVLVACVTVMAHHGPRYTALEPANAVLQIEPQTAARQKRSLLLGAGAAGLVGAGVLGAGLLGAGVVGAKAGFVGGALASGALNGYGRSYGGYGGYGNYYGYGSGYGGYGSYYPSSYVVSYWR